MLFQVFSRLARRHPTVHFLRLPSHYAEDLPATALPTILAYRRGALIANLVHLVDELPPGVPVTVSSVEGLLSKYLSPLTSQHRLTLIHREEVLSLEEHESDESI